MSHTENIDCSSCSHINSCSVSSKRNALKRLYCKLIPGTSENQLYLMSQQQAKIIPITAGVTKKVNRLTPKQFDDYWHNYA